MMMMADGHDNSAKNTQDISDEAPGVLGLLKLRV